MSNEIELPVKMKVAKKKTKKDKTSHNESPNLIRVKVSRSYWWVYVLTNISINHMLLESLAALCVANCAKSPSINFLFIYISRLESSSFYLLIVFKTFVMINR